MSETTRLYFEQEYKKCPLSLNEWLEANPDLAVRYSVYRGNIEEMYRRQLKADRAFIETKAARNKLCP